jgi:hypothetical protein
MISGLQIIFIFVFLLYLQRLVSISCFDGNFEAMNKYVWEADKDWSRRGEDY